MILLLVIVVVAVVAVVENTIFKFLYYNFSHTRKIIKKKKVCVCMYVFMYTCIYLYIYIHTDTHIFVSSHIQHSSFIHSTITKPTIQDFFSEKIKLNLYFGKWCNQQLG